LSHTCSPFYSGYFGDGVSLTVCLDWPWALILLISASQVARITDRSHQNPAMLSLLIYVCPERWSELYFFTVLGIKPRALHTIGKYLYW
jgi:hypothetical protein